MTGSRRPIPQLRAAHFPGMTEQMVVEHYGPMFEGRNILITGGLGFIGSTLARRLTDFGAHILLVDSLIPEYGGNLWNIHGIEDRVKVNIADVRDEHGMAHLIQGQDYLFNLAGQTSHLDSMRDPYTDLEINCRSQLSILEACRKHNPSIKVVYASTRQIYGKPRYVPVDESHPLYPTDVNGINKMAGEWYHIVYNNVYNIRAVSVRLTNTYGPRMRVKDARQTFLGDWIRLVIESKKIQVFGDGRQVRDLNYVDDVIDALLRVAASEEVNGQIFNLGGDEPISLGDLAQILIDMNGSGDHELVPFPPESRAIDIGDYYGNYGRLHNKLGWRPSVSLRRGLELTLAFYREHKNHYW